MVVLPVQVLAGCMAAMFAGVAPCRTATESIEVTAKAAVEALPAEIRPFFSSRREAFTAAAHRDRVAARESDNRKGNSHSIALDVIAAPTTTGDTVSRFPRRLSKARKLFMFLSSDRVPNSSLPFGRMLMLASHRKLPSCILTVDTPRYCRME